MTKIKVTYPERINLFKYSNKAKPLELNRDSICVNCDRIVGKKENE